MCVCLSERHAVEYAFFVLSLMPCTIHSSSDRQSQTIQDEYTSIAMIKLFIRNEKMSFYATQQYLILS